MAADAHDAGQSGARYRRVAADAHDAGPFGAAR